LNGAFDRSREAFQKVHLLLFVACFTGQDGNGLLSLKKHPLLFPGAAAAAGGAF
jgi:hypothetical protein